MSVIQYSVNCIYLAYLFGSCICCGVAEAIFDCRLRSPITPHNVNQLNVFIFKLLYKFILSKNFAISCGYQRNIPNGYNMKVQYVYIQTDNYKIGYFFRDLMRSLGGSELSRLIQLGNRYIALNLV